MFTIDPSILPVIAAIVASALTGLISLLGTIVSNRHAMRQQREQWKREDERLQQEAASKAKENEGKAQQEEKQRLTEIYSNCVLSLTTLLYLTNSLASDKYVSDENDYIGNANKWASLMSISHYDKESENYKSFINNHHSLMRNAQVDVFNLQQMRLLAIQFSVEDPRLK
jgi:hypothetical protein